MITLPLNETNLLVSVVIIGLLGIVNCFWGYRFFRMVLAIVGFFVGAGVGIALTGGDQQIIIALAALIGGVLGAILFYFLYFVGPFLAGIGLGITLGSLIASDLNVAANTANVIIIVSAALGGIVGLILSKYIIMISTAFVGAAQIITAITLLLPGTHTVGSSVGTIQLLLPQNTTLLMSLSIIILAIIGFMVQARLSQRVLPPTEVTAV
jgi:Domain of unknown function (DUF4203)